MTTVTFPSIRHRSRYIGRRIFAICIDAAVFALSGLLAFELRFDGDIPQKYLGALGVTLCIWVAVKSLTFFAAEMDRGSWRHTSAYDAVQIVMANTVGSLVGGGAVLLLLGVSSIPRSVYVIDWLLACFFTLAGRLVARVLSNTRSLQSAKSGGTRTLIYGAGSAGLALLWELRENRSLTCNVVGLVDDDPAKAHLILRGKRVLGSGESLASLVRHYDIQRILIAVPSATGPQLTQILRHALAAGVEYRMVPGLGDLIQGVELGKQIREVAVEDLLGRKPVELNQDRIRERIEGKVVMVTGAAGSIGSELCRQIARFRPLALIGFDKAETPLFQLNRELERCYPELVFHPEIGDISRFETLQRVMQNHRPSILYHAAAYKHVPMMEKHVFAAVENNIFGTFHVAMAAARNGVEDFVMISTDKAVRPTSVMGATKRVAELVIRALQEQSATNYVAVRFGNVLGSNGSVIPIFKEQIAAGGPVTVTHPDMTRYFMTIPEAAQLVLEAHSIGNGGEVFVLDMGEAVKIVDLARNLILLSGLMPGQDIKIEYVGLRPGEKLYEELNLDDEQLVPTAHTKIGSYIGPSATDTKKLNAQLQELQSIVDNHEVGKLILLLKELVPDYNPDFRLLKTALSGSTLRSAHGKIGPLPEQDHNLRERELSRMFWSHPITPRTEPGRIAVKD